MRHRNRGKQKDKVFGRGRSLKLFRRSLENLRIGSQYFFLAFFGLTEVSSPWGDNYSDTLPSEVLQYTNVTCPRNQKATTVQDCTY